MLTDKTYYRRNLPHIQPPDSVLFVTFRLAGSLPAEVQAALRLEKLRAEYAAMQGNKQALVEARKRYFARWDAALDLATEGPRWLGEPPVSAAVATVLHQLQNEGCYWLLSFCVMPNHVHVLVQTPELLQRPFYHTLQLLKGRSARAANQMLQRTGTFWQPESYDHVAANAAETRRILTYIVNNPVKAGLVPDWQDWSGTYAHPDAW